METIILYGAIVLQAIVLVFVIINNARIKIVNYRLCREVNTLLEVERNLLNRIKWYREKKNIMSHDLWEALEKIDRLKSKDRELRLKNFELTEKLNKYEQ